MIRLLVIAIVICPALAAAADYRLPCRGTWFVVQGGDTPNVNHHMSVPSQWYGVDLSKVGGASGRELFRGAGRTARDFYSWGEPVLSPVAGTVDAAHDGEPDNELGKADKSKPFGNYVRIRVADDEFVYLAHLQKGSVRVKAGDKLKAGQRLGRCGNSGNTTMPHIHMHVQNKRDRFSGRGQNVTFRGIDVELSHKRFGNVDWPLIRGLFVSNAPDAKRSDRSRKR